MAGLAITALSFLFVIVSTAWRLIVGPEADGLVILFGVVFFLIGLCLFGIGLLGDHVVRISQDVRQRPRYVIRTIVETEGAYWAAFSTFTRSDFVRVTRT